MTFWLTNPFILIDREHIINLYPKSNYDIDEKLNAITRLIILLTFIGVFVLRHNILRLIVTTIITLCVIIIYHKYKSKFEVLEGLKQMNNVNTLPTPNNPYMNTSPIDYGENPQRNKAANAYDCKITNNIKESVKSNLNKKLFKCMNDENDFNNFDRQFYTMPNTQIPNNQNQFMKFCYGNTSYEKDNVKTE